MVVGDRRATRLSVKCVEVAKFSSRELDGITSLRQLYSRKLVNPDDLKHWRAHAIVDVGAGQMILAQVYVASYGPLTIDFPFGKRNVTGVPPQIRNGALVVAERESRRATEPWYAREYGDDLSIERVMPGLRRLIGWDHFVDFDNGTMGQWLPFDYSQFILTETRPSSDDLTL